MAEVLLIDDCEAFSRALIRTLENEEHTVLWLRSCAEVRGALGATIQRHIRYALVDEHLGDGFGLDLLPLLDALEPRPAMALFSAEVSPQRALAALQAHRTLLPKPSCTVEIHALLEALDALQRVPGAPDTPLRSKLTEFLLDTDSVAVDGTCRTLPRTSIALLRYLLVRGQRFTSAREIGRELLGRRDVAAAALVRRRVADTRRALTTYGWLIESVPKRGYRLTPRASLTVHAPEC